MTKPLDPGPEEEAPQKFRFERTVKIRIDAHPDDLESISQVLYVLFNITPTILSYPIVRGGNRRRRYLTISPYRKETLDMNHETLAAVTRVSDYPHPIVKDESPLPTIKKKDDTNV